MGWELTGMNMGTIEYLLAALEKAGPSGERQMDIAKLREEVSLHLATTPSVTREMLNSLEFRNLITTKGAGRAHEASFFWITERGVEVAIEARIQGFTWPPKFGP